MIKTALHAGALLVAAALLALTAWAPLAGAHGAPAGREIDLRLLLDDDGGLAYGGCIEMCAPGAEPEGLDLLALDMREAFLASQPALVFRITVQSESVHDGRKLVLQVMQGTQVSTFTADNGDGTTYVSADFDRLDGPSDVGDGHPKAIDGWVFYSTLGLQAGDVLTGITVTSTHHDEPDDVMPGTWYFQGNQVPHAPHDADPAEAIEEHPPGEYVVAGPAPLLTATLDAQVLDLANGSANATLTISNPLAVLAQFANLTVIAPEGVAATLDATSLLLEPGASRQVQVSVTKLNTSGHAHFSSSTAQPSTAQANLTLAVDSDLGAFRAITLPVAFPPVNLLDAGHDHDDAEPQGKEAPGVTAPLVLLGLALAVWMGKRQRQPL